MIEGPYYEHPGEGYRDKRVRGHVYEALVPYSGEKSVRRLKVAATDSEGPPWYEVEEASLNDVRNAKAVPELELKDREAAIVRTAKCRRVVLLSAPPAHWKSGPTSSEGVYLVAPIYTFKAYDNEEHRSRVKAYAYNTLFYLPGDEAFAMPEACVRLDRVQPVHSSLLDGKPCKLTKDALDGLIGWYGAYLLDRVPDRIAKYRDAALAELKAAS